MIEQIQKLAPELEARNLKAGLIIFTDGLPTDGKVTDLMSQLRSLPVWIVIRLCTDDKKIVQFWNNIDKDLELDMDVLDDFKSEAKEVTKFNSWLTYGEPLHRLREFGICIKELDILDELSLTSDQILEFCSIV